MTPEETHMSDERKHIISAYVENRTGVLAHVAGMFASRGFNIDSLTVAETDDPRFSRMTIVTSGDEATLEQIRKQLQKVVDVIKVMDFSGCDYVERDLLLVKVAANEKTRSHAFEIVNVFRGKIVDISHNDLVVELAGPAKKIQAFLDLMKPFDIREVVRSGRIAMSRGKK